MKNFSDHFTQGGQTNLHKLHMMSQVMVATCKFCLFLSLLSFLIFLFYKQSWKDYYALIVFYKAKIRVSCHFLPCNFCDTSWVIFKNSWAKINDYNILSNPNYIELVKQMKIHIYISYKYSLMTFIISFIIISWFWFFKGKKRQQITILKGYELIKPTKLNKKIRKIGVSKLKIAGVSMPKGAELEHMIICGTTGSGKTNAINHLLSQIRKEKYKTIIVDSTGDFVQRFFNSTIDKILNPFDNRTQQWNLWKECIDEYDFDEFAESLIPTDKYDSFWTKAAQQLFSTAAQKMQQSREYSIEKLLDILMVQPLAEVEKIYQNTYVATYVNPNIEKTAMGIRATLIAALKNLKYLKNSILDIEQEFSIREWLANKQDNGWLFLSAKPTQREVLKPLMSAWLSIAVKSLMAMGEDKNRRVWFIIDELAALNYIHILNQGLAESRKYGGCFVLSFQDLYQLDNIYGSYAAKTLGALAGTKLIFRLDSYAAKQISEIFGEQEILESHESISFGSHQMRDGVSLSNQQYTKPLISTSDLMQLDNFEAYLKFPRNLPATKVKFALYQEN